MFDFLKSKLKKQRDFDITEDEVKRKAQEFVDSNSEMVLFNTVPFITDKAGKGVPNALSTAKGNAMYMPAFTNAEKLMSHYAAHGLVAGAIINGTLGDLLDSLDSHPFIKQWGVVIDPDSENAIEIPPNIRVTAK